MSDRSVRSKKRALRRSMVDRILALDPAARARQQATLETMLEALPGFGAAGTVLLYVAAFPEEIATAPFLRRALDLGKRLACPRVHRPARRLDLFLIDDPEVDFEPGSLDIPEPRPGCLPLDPAEVDWVLVPGLAFDGCGYRLGRGAGYYDRFLPTLRPDAPRWSLAYDEQWVEDLPVEPHDQPLDGIASPARMVVARRGRI